MTIDPVVKVLAVIGGGVLGGLGSGLLAQLLARAFAMKKLSRWPVLTVRLLGGVICGWLVALWLFGGGGAGIGGMGGWGFGSGTGKGESEQTSKVVKKEGEGKKDESTTQTPADETLRIEVLGSDVLKKADQDLSRCYRIDTEEGPRFRTFEEIKEAIRKRQEKQPPLRRIEIVLYKDSPEEHVPVVSRLRAWTGELNSGKMKVDISQPDADAPMK